MNIERNYICEQLLRETSLNDHNPRSYHEFLTKWLPHIVLSNGNIQTVYKDVDTQQEKYYTLTLRNCSYQLPEILPSKAYDLNLSYMGKVFVDVYETVWTKEKPEKVHENEIPFFISRKEEYPFCEKLNIYQKVHITSIHAMLWSSSCKLFYQTELSNKEPHEIFTGTFISRGKRRFIPCIPEPIRNYIFRLHNSKGNTYSVQIRSSHIQRPHRSTSTLDIYIGSVNPLRNSDINLARVSVPFQPHKFPIGIIALAYGWNPEDFYRCAAQCMGSKWDEKRFYKYKIPLMTHLGGCKTPIDAVRYISKVYLKPNRLETARNIIHSEILPHLNEHKNPRFAKGFYLAYCYGLLVLFREGVIKERNIDSCELFQILDSAASYATLFRRKYIEFIKQAVKVLHRVLKSGGVPNPSKVYNHERLSNNLNSAIATGSFSSKLKGKSQQLSENNMFDVIAQMRRICSRHINNDGLHDMRRTVKASQFGYICAAETPDGKDNCGLVLSMASTARLSSDTCPKALLNLYLKALGSRVTLLPVPQDEDDTYMGIFAKQLWRTNAIHRKKGTLFGPKGDIIGFFECDLREAYEIFINLRRKLIIDFDVTCSVDQELEEIRIFCMNGRLIRPLIITENLHKLGTILSQHRKCPSYPLIPELLRHGCIEYVSALEEKFLTVATSMKQINQLKGKIQFSHMEITDMAILGVTASLNPGIQHNPGPRAAYTCSMDKQGIPGNRDEKKGTHSVASSSYSLKNGQRPLVRTAFSQHLGVDDQEWGYNPMVLVYAAPYNPEDGIGISESFVKRGGFLTFSSRCYQSNKNGMHNSEGGECFIRPDPKVTFKMKNLDYSKIDEKEGIPEKGTRVDEGNIVIGKTVPIKRFSQASQINGSSRIMSSDYKKHMVDASTQVRRGEGGIVSNVIKSQNPKNNNTIVKVKIESERVPQVGDKFFSRHAQKGVILKVIPDDELPIAENGEKPDIIVSPLGLTSRMTMGMVWEMILGKAAALSGDESLCVDTQNFSNSKEEVKEKCKQIFKENGYLEDGSQYFIHPKTGKRIEEPLFMGPVFYVRLKHMVWSKIYSRSTGPRNPLTGQPTEGRRHGGGLRFSPMQSNSVNSHGAAWTLLERMLYASDCTRNYYCTQCGHQAIMRLQVAFCKKCSTGKFVVAKDMPQSTRLMIQELGAMNIILRLFC